MMLLSCWFAVIDFFLYFILNLLPPKDVFANILLADTSLGGSRFSPLLLSLREK